MPHIFSRWKQSSGIVIATLLLFAVSAVIEPNSLGGSSLASLWPFAAVLMIAALGQTLVVQQRGIDLSVPGFISVTVVMVTHLPSGNSSKLFGALVLTYLVCIVLGIVNGIMVTKIGIMPIVQTLGMNSVLFGIDLAISHGTPTQTTSALQNFTSGSIFGVPVPLVFAIVLVLVFEFVMKRTLLGRHFEASGVNIKAGRAAGLRVDKYQIYAYTSASIMYCTAGVLLAGIVSQPDPFQGNSYLLPSVAAVVLGGTSLLGGIGSPVASAVGALFLIQLQMFLLATGASAAVQNVVEALALAIGVAVYGVRGRVSSLRNRRRMSRETISRQMSFGDSGGQNSSDFSNIR